MNKHNYWSNKKSMIIAILFLLVSVILGIWPLFLIKEAAAGPFVGFACSKPDQLLTVLESVDSENSKISFTVIPGNQSQITNDGSSYDNNFILVHVYDPMGSFNWTCNKSAIYFENNTNYYDNLLPRYYSGTKKGYGKDVYFYVDYTDNKSFNPYDLFTIELKPDNYEVHVYDDDDEIYSLRIPHVSPFLSSLNEGNELYRQTIDGKNIYSPQIEVEGYIVGLGIKNNDYFLKDFYADKTSVNGIYYGFMDHQSSAPIVKYYSNSLFFDSEVRLLFSGLFFGVFIELFVISVKNKYAEK